VRNSAVAYPLRTAVFLRLFADQSGGGFAMQFGGNRNDALLEFRICERQIVFGTREPEVHPNGSVRYLPASVLGMASVRSRSKRLTASSQCSSPSVRTMTSESRSRSLSQNSISCCTHFDDATRGDASRMNCPDLLSAPSIDGHVPGLAERSVSSRNTLSARALYQGFASLCRAD